MLKKIYLEITDQCNLDCKTCYRRAWVDEPKDMPWPLLDKVIGQVNAEKELKTVVLGGMGEPMAAESFESVLQKLRQKEIWATTNGTLFLEKLTPEILGKVNLFIVSADGMHKNMEKIRGVDLDFWLKNIRHFNQMKKETGRKKPLLDIQFVASRDNIQDIFPLMDLLAELDINNLMVSNLMPVDEESAGQILHKRYENPEMRRLWNKIRNYSFKRGLRVILPEFELKTERRCAFVDKDATYITAGGEVVPCYRLSHDGKEYVFGRPKKILQYSFGSLKEKSLSEIWQSKDYVDFRRRIYNNHYPSCTDCELVEGCDLVKSTDFDCYGVSPSCADCLWARNFVFCN